MYRFVFIGIVNSIIVGYNNWRNSPPPSPCVAATSCQHTHTHKCSVVYLRTRTFGLGSIGSTNFSLPFFLAKSTDKHSRTEQDSWHTKSTQWTFSLLSRCREKWHFSGRPTDPTGPASFTITLLFRRLINEFFDQVFNQLKDIGSLSPLTVELMNTHRRQTTKGKQHTSSASTVPVGTAMTTFSLSNWFGIILLFLLFLLLLVLSYALLAVWHTGKDQIRISKLYVTVADYWAAISYLLLFLLTHRLKGIFLLKLPNVL